MNWIQATIIFGPIIVLTIAFWDDIKWAGDKKIDLNFKEDIDNEDF